MVNKSNEKKKGGREVGRKAKENTEWQDSNTKDHAGFMCRHVSMQRHNLILVLYY